jgi:hypothetical protein
MVTEPEHVATDADYHVFWAAVQTLADVCREQDPELVGRITQLAAHFRSLPEPLRVRLRLDLQLLLVQLPRLALAVSAERPNVSDPLVADSSQAG